MTRQELYKLPDEEQLEILNKIKEETGKIPPEFNDIYDILERSIKSDAFNKSKAEWCELYPDFKTISEIMINFRTDKILVEFRKSIPPPSIFDEVLRVYKKCISYKEKFSKKIQRNLNFSHDTPVMFYAPARYCINKECVHAFLNQYQKWYGDLYPLWNKVRYEAEDFFNNSGYDRLGWDFYIQRPDFLKRKAGEIQALHDRVVGLLNTGKDLINKLDVDISLEYDTASFEMSLHEREQEILRRYNECDLPDEAYCYVYTLECDLFVFYVGIASNPKERFEQHIRGAFSDESKLFKSKFIQKYNGEVTQNIVYQGTRRQCKVFERDYIAKHNPLGNMTEGGEG
jgi:hypothetical protein